MSLPKRIENLERETYAPSAMRIVPAAPVAFDTPADVLKVLGEQVNALRSDASPEAIDKAKTLGFLSGMALKAMEAKDVAARLEAVERVLRLRKDAATTAIKKPGRH